MEQKQESSLFQMDVDPAAQSYLASISKWTKFIFVIGLIACILVLLAIVGTGGSFVFTVTEYAFNNSKTAVVFSIVIFLIIGVLAASWLYFLFRTSSLIRRALVSRNAGELADAFRSLKNLFTISIIFSVLSLMDKIISLLNK